MTHMTTTDTGAGLRSFLAVHRITVTELARGVRKSRTHMQRVTLGRDQATDALKSAVIAFLGQRTGQTVTVEDIFGE